MIFTLNENFEEYNICIFLVISWCFVELKKTPNIIFLRIPFVDIIFTAFLVSFICILFGAFLSDDKKVEVYINQYD